MKCALIEILIKISHYLNKVWVIVEANEVVVKPDN